MRVNQGRIPPGGYHFEVAPGVKLTAATFEKLYGLITEYRARHGLPAGDPQRDVDDYICGKWPNFCQPDGRESPAKTVVSLSRRVAEWAGNLVRTMPAGGYELVDTREAARRAEVCRNCPFQESWRQKCTPCNASSEALLSTVRRMKRTGISNELLGCNVCGTDNATEIWLPESVLRPNDELRPRLPQNCYKLKIP